MIIKKIFNRLYSDMLLKIIFPSCNFIYELVNSRYYILTASIDPVFHNWGDDANLWISKFVNPVYKFIPNKYSWNIKNRDNILCIGSIISWMTNSKSVIWGSGVVYPNQKIQVHPKKVCAVRGPLTRKYLLEQGVDCPQIYGDPALLFPLYYKPKVYKTHKYGIIPHFRDKNNDLLEKLSCRLDVLVIDVQNINPWHRFIDDINRCEYVLSSSLHGIIISDTYGVPNCWVEFPFGERKRFAFYDYLQSVGKSNINPIQLGLYENLDDIIPYLLNWTSPQINLKKLIDVCPFNLKC